MSHETSAYSGNYHETDDGDIVPLDAVDEYGYSDERYPDARAAVEKQEQWHREGVTEADTVLPERQDGQEESDDHSVWEDIGSHRPLTTDERRLFAAQAIGNPREVARAKDVQFYADKGIGRVEPDERTDDEKRRAHDAYIAARAEVTRVIDANKKNR